MSTVAELADQIYTRLSLGTGLDVQTYAAPKILTMVQHKFDVLFDALWWPAYYTPAETYTLDGTTGVITGDLTTKVKRWEDLRAVWYNSERSSLPLANPMINPSIITRRSIAPYGVASKVFKVIPATTSGNVTIAYRTKPDAFTADSTVGIDDQLLILGCCYDFVVDDDSNERAAEKFKSMFDNRYKQLVDAQNIHGISTESYQGSSNEEWR